MTDQTLNEKPDVGDITGIGKAVQHGADRMGDDKVLAVAGVVILGVDEVERDIARLVQRHLHLQLAAHELDCVLAHLKFPGVELLHVQRVEVLQDNAVPDALGGKGKMVGDIMEAEYYGIAAKKGNKALVKQVNEALAALKKNGEYDKIYKKWFGA